MRFAICNEIFGGWTLDDTFARVKQLGYAGVELAPFTLANALTDLTATERRRIRDLAESHQLSIVGLHWLLVKPDGLHLNHPDAAIRSRTAAYFIELVNCCADLGGSVLVVGSPRQRQVQEGVAFAQALDWTAETLRGAVRRAEERGVVVCIEPLAPTETNLINTAAEAIEFTRRLDSPACKIVLDVKAMCAETASIPEIIRRASPHFAHFHANDRNLKEPGAGAVDFKPIAAALRETDYSGWVSVEVFNFEEGAEAIASNSIEYLRRVFEAPHRP